jgi:hypothetical protein
MSAKLDALVDAEMLFSKNKILVKSDHWLISYGCCMMVIATKG